MSIFATLGASSGTLRVFERGLEVVQNNIGNASTPDYAAQQTQFDSYAFQPGTGQIGGLKSVIVKDTRDRYADQSVRQELSHLGTAEQQASILNTLQGNFDVTGENGIPGGLNSFFSAFSALSVNPSDPLARQTVIDDAQKIAQSFQTTASSLASASAGLDQQIAGKVAAINNLSAQIQELNVERQRSSTADPNLDARVQSALESLSEIANVSATFAPDGTATVLLGGQTPLVIGAQQFQIQSGFAPTPVPPPANPGGTPAAVILDANGGDVTAQVSQGQLAGLLQIRNTVLPSVRGDQSQTGSLNQLAQSFADRVNTLLTSGNISNGPPVQPGIALFTYDAANPTNAAQSISVNPAISSSQIATIDPGPPAVGNGIALKVAAIAQGTNAADQIAGVSITSFFGQIAASIGSKASDAANQSDLYTQSAAQAKNLRDQISGVSLDTEAVNLIALQKSYDATAKLISVLDQITQSTIDILK